ncbi:MULTISPECIES: hypothetical protein [Acidiphilium]|uniref:Uncharacterized protein n=1 Tax=Acidiphilium rubrum TaxID=526 RepID=A0A8G2CJD2_ACIRU|nr:MULTISPECIES: hypothetical protein [Acidiphilium]SIQ21256.1 hypothetical protein SAMN05421828_102222 [Acidiphilium rubrum]
MTIALVFLLLAATLGGYLSIGYLRGTPPPAAGWMLGLVHGVVGAAGLLELVIGLERHPPPASAGVAGFGVGAEVLLGLAILLGLLVIMAAWRGKRLSGVVIGAHASVAITAIALVSAIVALG